MPSLRVLSLATVFFALGRAQQCYYPDGSSSSDVPCSNASESSCCGSSSFCMDNGLCFGGGILSRGSCTDKSWASDACTSYCKADDTSSSVALTPCSDNGSSHTFVCGLNGTSCSNDTAVFSLSGSGTIVLRASQVEALVGAAISTLAAANTSCASNSTLTAGLYTSSQMTGLGLGLGFPLLFAICAALFFFHRERKNAPPKLMYKLPDDHDDFLFQAPSRVNTARNPSLRFPPPLSRGASDAASIVSSVPSSKTVPAPAHMQTFVERYMTMAEKNGVSQRAVELPGSPMAHELGERRASTRDQKFS